MMRKLAILVAICAISPLVHGQELNDPAFIENGVSVDYDKFKKKATYKGPAIRIMRPGNAYWHVIFLRAYKLDGKQPSDIHVYVETHYKDSRYIVYKRAYDDSGAKLPVSQIDHDVVSCSGNNECLFEEVYAIELSKSYLESRAKKEEVEFKVEGVTNYMTFRIPGGYIKGFLNAVKSAKAID
jgi:hypothetical protein